MRSHDRFKTRISAVHGYVMQNWDFSAYDVILTSSATTAKYVRNHRARHICYCCFHPTRAIWTRRQIFRRREIWIARGAVPARLWRGTLQAARLGSRAPGGYRFIAISQLLPREQPSGAILRPRFATVLFSPIDVSRRFAPGAAIVKNRPLFDGGAAGAVEAHRRRR